MGKRKQKSDFSLTGRFLTYILSKNCEVKGIRLATPQGEQDIKLAKKLRPACAQILQPGTWVQIHGRQQLHPKTGKVKFKAQVIIPVLPSAHPASVQIPSSPAAIQQQGKIKICQKSGCRKRGSKQVSSALHAALQNSGRAPYIQLQSTGCMGHCKTGPNLVVLPDKARYKGVKPKNAIHILHQHF